MIYLSHLLMDEDMKEILEKTELGIETIEFSIGYCLDQGLESLENYKKRLVQLPHSALSVHGPFLDLNPASNDTMIREATKVRFQQSYDMAVKLGAKKIIYHTCFVPQVNFMEGWVDLAVLFWKEFLADKGEEIQVHMENVFDPTYYNMKEVIQQVNHPAFSICLDIGHANHASKLPVSEWIAGLGDTIGHIHIHDNDGITDGHLAVGDGNLPWGDIQKALQQYCPSVDYTIENCTKKDVEKTLRFLNKGCK